MRTKLTLAMSTVALLSLAVPASAQEPISGDDCLAEGIVLESEGGVFVCNYADADYDAEYCSEAYGGVVDEEDEDGLCTRPIAEAEPAEQAPAEEEPAEEEPVG